MANLKNIPENTRKKFFSGEGKSDTQYKLQTQHKLRWGKALWAGVQVGKKRDLASTLSDQRKGQRLLNQPAPSWVSAWGQRIQETDVGIPGKPNTAATHC